MEMTLSLHPQGAAIEFNATGAGVPILFLPGSYSTGAAWRGMQRHLKGGYRQITTSLCGYGGTDDTRRSGDLAMEHEVQVVETAARRIGAPFHLVGHSFGGTVALAAALARRFEILSLTLFEPNPLTLIRDAGRRDVFDVVRALSTAFDFAVKAGDASAAARIIDFWDGPGAFAALPAPVQAFCRQYVRCNLRDWQTDFDFDLRAADLATLDLPVLIVKGASANPAMAVICDALAEALPRGRLVEIPGAGHSLIRTHGAPCADILSEFLSETG